MTLTPAIIALAAGLWISLLVAAVLFLLIAIRAKQECVILGQQLADKDNKISELNVELTEAQNQESSGDNHEQFVSLEKQVHKLSDELQELLVSSTDKLNKKQIQIDELTAELDSFKNDSSSSELIEQVREAEHIASESESLTKVLKQENELLERQLQALTEQMEVGDMETMREMIVNFTEESRELLQAIAQLESEKMALESQLKDTESNEKGTTGAVVGLKRKLAAAEAEISVLQNQ